MPSGFNSPARKAGCNSKNDNDKTPPSNSCRQSHSSDRRSPSYSKRCIMETPIEDGEGLPVLTILIERTNLYDSAYCPDGDNDEEGTAPPPPVVTVAEGEGDHPTQDDETATTTATTLSEAATTTTTSRDDSYVQPHLNHHLNWTSNDSHANRIAPYAYEPLEQQQQQQAGKILHRHHHRTKLSMIRLNTRPTLSSSSSLDNNINSGDAMTTTTIPHRPNCSEVERSMTNPSLPMECQKYWNQRHRLFSKFDEGIRLDTEGWFSVTPEQIANHVAAQVPPLVECQQKQQQQQPQPHLPNDPIVDDATTDYHADNNSSNSIILLDAFGGCGGNAIAFAKRPEISLVLCVDLDREKLRHTAHNAKIYGIPTQKIRLVECNVIFILQFCYRNGTFILDAPLDNAADAMAMMDAMPPAVPMERYEGFSIGGIDLLPRNIHVVFLDPPWGGVDYNAFGRFGYSLQDHMRIPRRHLHLQEQKAADAFFDTFAPTTEQERKAAFNCTLDLETNCVSGAELLRLAAQAGRNATVIYDIPRNTNRNSLGDAALAAGYRGNCKLDEHYLNGRLKTVTAYFGMDWRNECQQQQAL